MKRKSGGKEHHPEVQVCPGCLGLKVSKLSASSGDMTGALAILPPKYICSECGWTGRLVLMRDIETCKDNND
jgi:hypothetical protein